MTTSNEHNNAPAVPQEEGRPGIPLRKAYKHLLIVAPAQEVGLTNDQHGLFWKDAENKAEYRAQAWLIYGRMVECAIIAALRAKGGKHV